MVTVSVSCEQSFRVKEPETHSVVHTHLKCFASI